MLQQQISEYFLGSVCDANETSEQWTVQLQVNFTPTKFTVINEDTLHTLTPERTLAPPDNPLDSPGGELPEQRSLYWRRIFGANGQTERLLNKKMLVRRRNRRSITTPATERGLSYHFNQETQSSQHWIRKRPG